MTVASKVKKTISLAGMLPLSASALTKEPKNEKEAFDRHTGPNQPESGKFDLCIRVQPYFLGNFSGHLSHFIGFVVDEVSPKVSDTPGECSLPDEDRQCERGFVRVTSMVQLFCRVPVSL